MICKVRLLSRATCQPVTCATLTPVLRIPHRDLWFILMSRVNSVTFQKWRVPRGTTVLRVLPPVTYPQYLSMVGKERVEGNLLLNTVVNIVYI